MPTLTEKYRPKLSEIVGNERGLARFEGCIKEKAPVILHGESGIGKTSSVYAIAEKQGLQVLEWNASDERKKEDLLNVMRVARMKGFRKFLVLLDEVDGLKEAGSVVKVINESIHPVVLTANELYKVPKLVREKCIDIRFYDPKLSDVLKRVKVIAEKEKVKPQYDQVSGDVRASINTVVYGSDVYKSVNEFEEVQQIFQGKSVENVDRNFLIWLIDNCSRFYDGRKLYEVIQTIMMADLTGRMELLKLLPKGKHEKAEYPFFLRRLKVMRGK